MSPNMKKTNSINSRNQKDKWDWTHTLAPQISRQAFTVYLLVSRTVLSDCDYHDALNEMELTFRHATPATIVLTNSDKTPIL